MGVVLAFTKPRADTLRASLGDNTPIEKRKLFAFQRVTLAAGTSTTLTFNLKPSDLAMVDAEGHTSLHQGQFDVVFSRGHGVELSTMAAVEPEESSAQRLKTFRKWWSDKRETTIYV